MTISRTRTWQSPASLGFRMPAEPKLQNPAQRVDHFRPSFFTVPHRVFVKAAGVLRPGGRLALADMAAVKQR